MADELTPETWIRVGAFIGVFVVMASWEVLEPRRVQAVRRAFRWPSNLGILIFDSVLVRLVFPVTAVGWAVLAQQRGWGLLHVVAVPDWLRFLLAFLLLDLAIYLQHRPAVRHLSGPAAGRPRGDGDRPDAVLGSKMVAAGPDAGAALGEGPLRRSLTVPLLSGGSKQPCRTSTACH